MSTELPETPSSPTAPENKSETAKAPDAAAPAGDVAAPADRASAHDASGDDHDDGGEGEGDETLGAAAGPAEGGEKKKRRRRRKKKKPAEGAVASGDGATPGEGGAEGAAAGERPAGERPAGDRPAGEGKKKKRHKKGGGQHAAGGPPRERPAFNVSDVVFGKILEVDDDVIVVDLSGKAKAIFDKLELVLPEDSVDVEDEARRAEELAESILAGTIDPDVGLAGAAEAAAVPAPEATEAAAVTEPAPDSQAPRGKIIRIVRAAATEEAKPSEEATPAATAEGDATAPTEAAAAEAAVAPTEATDAAPAPTTPESPAPAEEPKPSVLQLPRVVLEPGAPFVGVVRNDGARGGMLVLTHHPHRASKSKPHVAAAFKKKSEIFGIVTGVIKGGVEVDVEGVRAFAPGSQMELRLGADLHHLVGKRLPFLVTHYAKRGRDVIVSRRSMLEAEAKVAREAALSKLAAGQTIDGIVRSVVQFGAFVDLGGVEGLVPLTEMSHNRGDRPSDVFKVGETVPVLVQRIDEKGKIWLSRKATLPDPWGDAVKKYAMWTRHTGKVVRIQPFGAFVELERGIDGLIHTADLSIKRIETPEDVVKVGDEIEVVVASLDGNNHKIGLHPALTGAMAEEARQKLEVGATVKAAVVSIEAGGLTMRILGATGRNARAFMPASATGTPRGTELRKLFPPGHILDAKIIEKDPRRGEVKLSIKAMQQDNERSAYQQYRQQVKREAKFGTFAELLQKKK